MPSCSVGLACDITKAGDTGYTNESIDHTPVAWDGLPATGAALHTGDLGADDIVVSPINGDFSEVSPTYLISGPGDVLRCDTARTNRKLRRARFPPRPGHRHDAAQRR